MWCNYVVLKKDKVLIPMGKVSEGEIQDALEIVEEFHHILEDFECGDYEFLDKSFNKLSTKEISKIGKVLNIIEELSFYNGYYDSLFYLYFHIPSDNEWKFITEDELDKYRGYKHI